RYLNPNLFQFPLPLAAAASSDRPCRRDARESEQTLTSDDGAPPDRSPCLPSLGSSFDLFTVRDSSCVVVVVQVLQNDIDLLNPPAELEKLKHKKKRLVQSPNSFFMDVKCQGCFNITTVFSHSQTVVVCPGCQTVLCQPTGGKARLTEGCSFRRKGD
uniref:40S ribosomal protein S27 n=1 Tax=Aegilops tauschii subsp. strangulata TaxID=200361 RepID=A0A453T425_AEGTS